MGSFAKLSTPVGVLLRLERRTMTLPETNIGPENRPSLKETVRIPTIHFQVLLLLLSGRAYV